MVGGLLLKLLLVFYGIIPVSRCSISVAMHTATVTVRLSVIVTLLSASILYYMIWHYWIFVQKQQNISIEMSHKIKKIKNKNQQGVFSLLLYIFLCHDFLSFFFVEFLFLENIFRWCHVCKWLYRILFSTCSQLEMSISMTAPLCHCNFYFGIQRIVCVPWLLLCRQSQFCKYWKCVYL